MPLRKSDLVAPASALERTPEEWSARLAEWGEPRFRGKQVFKWLHSRGVSSAEEMTDLSKSLRERIASELEGLAIQRDEAGRIVGGYGFVIETWQASSDGTRKMLLQGRDGARIESVLLPQGAPGAESVDDSDGEDGEVARDTFGNSPVQPISQCISTQVGCAMGCVFCASGIAGLKRNLSAAEIVGQVLLGRALARDGERLRNVVLMGMGEPLHNYDSVARALVLMTHDEGLALSTRRVTLSTSGLVPQIDKLGRDFGGQVQLAVSLHSTSDERRSALMPINRKHNLAELTDALRRYPLPPRRRITIEYTLIGGENDGLAEARSLVELLRGIPVKVNLIPMNPVPESTLSASTPARVDEFQHELRRGGVATFVRRTRGDDIAAACGQLVLPGAKRTVRIGPRKARPE